MNIEFSSVAEKDLKDACAKKKNNEERLEDKRINIYKSGSCSCLLVAAAEYIVLNAIQQIQFLPLFALSRSIPVSLALL
jgi:hypothetical protein